MIRLFIYTMVAFGYLILSSWDIAPGSGKPDYAAVLQEVVRAKPASSVSSTPVVVNPELSLKRVNFQDLPGWDKARIKNSLIAFQQSCQNFLKLEPTHSAGSKQILLKAQDWQPACKAAVLINDNDEGKARQFFEHWFYPVELNKKKPVHGVFTGYYTPQVQGSLTKTREFNTPVYGLPRNLDWNNKKRNSFPTREQIDSGALKNKAPILAWINSPAQRLFMEIEGAGVIKLDSGKNLYLGYAGENGAPYTSVGGALINKGIFTKDNASKNALQHFLEGNSKTAQAALHQNQSFVFFQHLQKPITIGAQGMALTPGYSLAIDRRWIPLGAPLWLDTKIPSKKTNQDKQFQRLMVAQDTGGAIRGLVRGDIYWGSSKRAAYLGEHMKNEGRYWLLLPKNRFNILESHFLSGRMHLVIDALSHWPTLLKHHLLNYR